MATYTCDSCGMSVDIHCAECGAELVPDEVTKDGSSISVAKCPNGHGMIMSPMCCAENMTCTAA
ncbi:MAG: hypothetical protein R3234_12365 [Thermoanaerobaculia bacterium]|nr:hypothetical protein [Thermoanaerobaculia bacterium]